MDPLDVLILHRADAKSWSDYLAGQLDTSSVRLSVKMDYYDDYLVSESDSTRNTLKRSRLKLLIVSPDLFTFLCENTSCSFKDIIQNPQRVIMFFCGVKQEDFGTYEVLDRFPHLLSLPKYDHEQIPDLLKKVVEIVEIIQEEELIAQNALIEPTEPAVDTTDTPYTPPRLPGPKPEHLQRDTPETNIDFELVPSVVNAESDTAVVISLSEPLQGTPAIQIELCSEVGGLGNVKLRYKRLNPYTLMFQAPRHIEGSMVIRLKVDGTYAGSKPFVYQSTASQTADLLQLYIHCIDLLCELCVSTGHLSTVDIDKCLISLLLAEAHSTIPLVAFEKLFGMYEFSIMEKSRDHLPTLLHLAAKYGLEELTSKLLDLPGVWDANDIANCDGKHPHDLASINNHNDLCDVLQSSRDIIDIVHDNMYLPMKGYYNTTPVEGRDEIDGMYTTASDLLQRAEPAMLKTTSKGYISMNRKQSAPVISMQPQMVWQQRRSKTLPSEDAEEDYEIFDPSMEGGDRSGCGVESDSDNPDPSHLQHAPQTGHDGLSGQKPLPAEPLPTDPFKTPLSSTAHPAALGSSRQQELIDIMNEVKNGTLTQGQAVMLYNDWQGHLFDGTKDCSFKERAARLGEMRENFRQMHSDIAISRPQMKSAMARPRLNKMTHQIIPECENPEDLYLALVPGTPDACRDSTTSSGTRESSRSSRSSGFVDDGETDDILRPKSNDKTRRRYTADYRKSLRMEALEAQLAKEPANLPLDLPVYQAPDNPHSKPLPPTPPGLTYDCPRGDERRGPTPSARNPAMQSATLPRNLGSSAKIPPPTQPKPKPKTPVAPPRLDRT